MESGEAPCHAAGGVAGKRRNIEAHGAGAPCGMKESGALDSLPFPCQQMATTRHDLTELAAGCWLLAVGHCQRAKNHARKSRWRELRKLMIFGASALGKLTFRPEAAGATSLHGAAPARLERRRVPPCPSSPAKRPTLRRRKCAVRLPHTKRRPAPRADGCRGQ